MRMATTASTVTVRVEPLRLRIVAVPLRWPMRLPATSMPTTPGSELVSRSPETLLPTATGGTVGFSSSSMMKVGTRNATSGALLSEAGDEGSPPDCRPGPQAATLNVSVKSSANRVVKGTSKLVIMDVGGPLRPSLAHRNRRDRTRDSSVNGPVAPWSKDTPLLEAARHGRVQPRILRGLRQVGVHAKGDCGFSLVPNSVRSVQFTETNCLNASRLLSIRSSGYLWASSYSRTNAGISSNVRSASKRK